MDEIFNPSLILSLGPLSKKALLYTKKHLSNAPTVFLDLIDFYEVQAIDLVSKDIQEIIDTRLLSAKSLNKLLDMGYKVRNENISYVRLNLYIFWEASEGAEAVLEVIKLLNNLNYGNIDNSQHSGVCLFVIPIFDKKWTDKENNNALAYEELIKLKDYLSLTESMLRLDSKIYLLHSITNDGTRIPKEELIYISSILVYLNVIPSKEPPLSSYIKRVLMHEGSYKIGTIGISSLMVFKDKIEDGFSSFLCRNIINHALEYENIQGFQSCKFIDILNLHSETKAIMEKIDCIDEEGKLKLVSSNMEEIALGKDISKYPELMKNWRDRMQLNYVTELREKLKYEAEKDNKIKAIDEELKAVYEKNSLKEGLNYLNSVLNHIDKDFFKNKEAREDDVKKVENKLKKQVESCTDYTHYIIKGALLLAALSIILIGFIIPYTSGGLRISSIIALVIIGFTLGFLYYKYNLKKLHSLTCDYKAEVLKVEGRLLNSYAENLIIQQHERLKVYVLEKKNEFLKIMEALERVKSSLNKDALEEEELLGSLVEELLDYEDKQRLYANTNQNFKELYGAFINKLGGIEAMGEENIKDKLLEFSSFAAKPLGNLDFNEYFKLKYKDQSSTEITKWLNRALVKANYLLQFIKTNLEEEHLLIVASPEIIKLLNRSEDIEQNRFKYSSIASSHINTNCIAVVRICLGIDLDNIISF